MSKPYMVSNFRLTLKDSLVDRYSCDYDEYRVSVYMVKILYIYI